MILYGTQKINIRFTLNLELYRLMQLVLKIPKPPKVLTMQRSTKPGTTLPPPIANRSPLK